MEHSVEYYLSKTPEELKSTELKKEIIDNSNRYIFTWFCQSASVEQLEALLEGEGINILAVTSNLRDKLNGLLSSGNEFDFFQNEKMCNIVLENNALEYIRTLSKDTAFSLMEYIYTNKKDGIIEAYMYLQEEVQVEILKEMAFENDEKRELLKRSKKQSAEYLLTWSSLDLRELSIGEIEALIEKEVIFPSLKYEEQLTEKIVSIGDVNRYRFLINKLEEYHDVSQIEERRRKQYEAELATINEDGLLEKFQNLKDLIKSRKIPVNSRGILEGIEGFEGCEKMIYELMFSRRDIDEAIKQINDYYISNIIIDYFFKDVPTNVLKNITSMLAYDAENPFLGDLDKDLYRMIQNIDAFDSKHKCMLFEVLKMQGIDRSAKFYDDFSLAKETMVKQINDSIITEENVNEFYNEELSNTTGVPVYYLHGQKFKCLVRNVGGNKDFDILDERHLGFIHDGSSFSLDGSELLCTFGNNKVEYTLAYSGVPAKQLIHSFPVDSFTKYTRSYKDDIPENRNATERVLGFYTPEQFTTIAKEYNEILISVPNIRKNNELEEQLEAPKPFAIYCYDQISPYDIESAKKLGLGIILVDTKCYEIDRNGRVSMHETINAAKRKKYDYMRSYQDDDERLEK